MKKNKIIGLSVTALAFAAAAGVIGTRVAKEAIHAAYENPKTLYCKVEEGWWKDGGAAVGAYYWKSADESDHDGKKWPGTRMSSVVLDTDVWKFEIPAGYDRVIFTRVNGNGDISDWGAKTADLTVPTDDKNLYTLASEDPVWGDPGVPGTWSVYEEPTVTHGHYLVGNSIFTKKEAQWDFESGYLMTGCAEGYPAYWENLEIDENAEFKVRYYYGNEDTKWVTAALDEEYSFATVLEGGNVKITSSGTYNVYLHYDAEVHAFLKIEEVGEETSSESVSESVSESASEEPAPLAASIKINENLIPMEPVALEYANQVARWKVSNHVLEDDVVSFYVAEEKISLFSAPEDEENKNNIKNKDDEAHEEYLIHNEADVDFYLMKWKDGTYSFWATGYEAEEPFVDESEEGFYYLIGDGSFLNDTYKDHPWSYKAGVMMTKTLESDDLGQLFNLHLTEHDVFKLRLGQAAEGQGYVGFSKVADSLAKVCFEEDAYDNIVVKTTGNYNIFLNKEGEIYINGASPDADISGEIFFAPGAGGAPLADFYLYSWKEEGKSEKLGEWPGTKLSEIEGVAGTNGLNFHGVYGALIKIPAAALAGGDHFILSTEGEVVKTKDLEYLDGSFYGINNKGEIDEDKSLGAPAALAFDVDAAIKAATGESVCNIETNKAKTLVQDYDKLGEGQKAAFEDSTFYTINSEKTEEKIDVTGSAIINMINSHIVNGGEGSLYKTLGMNDSNRTLIITLAVIGAIAIASATFIVISKKRKAK
ncbi:MAG: hypothetical protein SPL02_01535 [Bacilli bacterium]|nr:hypothetical protein [Bacilli bacterium]MDY6430640.1 hypothetical protein [Bacilli bacterium]